MVLELSHEQDRRERGGEVPHQPGGSQLRQDRQERNTDHQRGSDVAQVDFEQVGPLFEIARPGWKEQIGDARERGGGRQHAHHAAAHEQDPADGGGCVEQQHEWPQRPDRVMQAGRKARAPEREMADLGDDGLLQCFGERRARTGERDGPEMESQTERVARFDQVVEVPPAACQQSGHRDDGEHPAACTAWGAKRHADGEDERGDDERELGAGREPESQPGHRQQPAVVRRVCDQRGGGEQRREADRVIERLARLGGGEHRQREHQAPGEQRQTRDVPGAPEAPGGEQAKCEPREVEQGGEEVVVERRDADRVEELRVGRVVGDERVRLRELDACHRAALGEACGERHVVPERVEVAHPRPERVGGLQAPLCGHHHDPDAGGEQRQVVRGRGYGVRCRGLPEARWRRSARPGQPVREHRQPAQQRDQRRGTIQRDQAEQLGAQQERAEADHDLGEEGRRTGHTEMGGAQPVCDHGRWHDERGEAHEAEEKLAGGHRRALPASSREHARSGTGSRHRPRIIADRCRAGAAGRRDARLRKGEPAARAPMRRAGGSGARLSRRPAPR